MGEPAPRRFDDLTAAEVVGYEEVSAFKSASTLRTSRTQAVSIGTSPAGFGDGPVPGVPKDQGKPCDTMSGISLNDSLPLKAWPKAKPDPRPF